MSSGKDTLQRDGVIKFKLEKQRITDIARCSVYIYDTYIVYFIRMIGNEGAMYNTLQCDLIENSQNKIYESTVLMSNE